MTVRESHAVEWRVREAIIEARREVREVKIHVHGEGEDGSAGVPSDIPVGGKKDGTSTAAAVTSDFGREGC